MVNADPEKEYDLVVRLKRGDVEAFHKLYVLYSARLYGMLVKLTKSETVSEDLLQNVFLKVWTGRDHIDPTQTFRAYLFKIAENLAYDFFRQSERDLRRRKELLLRTILYYEQGDEACYRHEKEMALYQAIESLPPQRKQVFTLCKLNGKSYEEVSQLLRISASTINDHIVKATRFLRERLKGQFLLLLLLNLIKIKS